MWFSTSGERSLNVGEKKGRVKDLELPEGAAEKALQGGRVQWPVERMGRVGLTG